MMIFALLATFALSSSLSYVPGETFSYRYNSKVNTAAVEDTNSEQATEFEMSCTAKFKVMLVSDSGAYIQMTIEDVRNTVSNSEETEETQHDEDSEQTYANPLYFTHHLDGSISDVAAHEDDTEELVNTKVNIAYSLRTTIFQQTTEEFEQSSVIDAVGAHYEFFQMTTEDSETIINSHYSENDFVGFYDSSMSADEVSLDGVNVRVMDGDHITSSKSQMYLIMNKPTEQSNDEEDEQLLMTTFGTAQLNGFAQGNTEEVNFEYASAEEHRRVSKKFKPVPYVHHTWYVRRQPRHQTVVDTLDMVQTCPGNIDLCKSFDKTWTLGNKNIGLQLVACAMAGVTKGCQDTSRSYMVGAYASINILILGKTITAANAIAEYGQVYGSPLRNKIELSLFGKVFYQKTLPYIDCINREIPIANFNKDFSFSWSILVYIVKLSFSAGLTVGFSAKVTYTVCPMQLKGSITFIPEATVTVHGGAEASIVLAKAGITLSGSVADYLDPTAYVDGNICRVGFNIYNNLRYIEARLEGWFQLRTIKISHWKIKITWGSKHSVTFWRHTWPGRRDKIVDIFYGAK